MLTLKNVSKKFGRHQVLQQISFRVPAGSITGLLGPNGAGKTTTLRIISGFLTPNQGEIYLGRQSMRRQPLALKARIGYLPENNPLYSFLTPRQYLTMIGHFRHLKGMALQKEVATFLEASGLQEYQQRRIEVLSRGYRQRVGLAAAFLGRPDLVLLDEPTSSLDPNQQLEMRQFIRRFGKTVLFSSHILAEVEAICDRVILINRGKIVYQGPLAGLTRPARRLKIKLNGGRQPKLFLTKLKKALAKLAPAVKLSASRAGQRLTLWLSDYQSGQAQQLKSLLINQAQKAGWQIDEISEARPSLVRAFQQLTKQ